MSFATWKTSNALQSYFAKAKPPGTQQKALAVSAGLTATYFVLLAFVADCIAIYYQARELNNFEVKAIFNNEIEHIKVLYYVPIVTYVVDFIALIGVVLAGVAYFSFTCGSKDLKINCLYIDMSVPTLSLAAIILLLLVVICNHLYYIMIAFVSDTYYASSLTVYYFILAVVNLYVFYWTYKMLLHIRETHKRCWTLRLFFMSGIAAILVGYQIMITLFFVFIPIRESINQTPNSIFIVYQIPLMLLAALGFYKSVAKSGPEELIDAIVKAQKDLNTNGDTVDGSRSKDVNMTKQLESIIGVTYTALQKMTKDKGLASTPEQPAVQNQQQGVRLREDSVTEGHGYRKLKRYFSAELNSNISDC